MNRQQCSSRGRAGIWPGRVAVVALLLAASTALGRGPTLEPATSPPGPGSGAVIGSSESKPLFPGRIASGGEKRVASEEPSLARGVLVPLVTVIGLACLSAWVLRRAAAASGPGLLARVGAPAGIIEVLGRYPLGRGQTLMLLRVDRRVLLLAQHAGLRGTGPGLSTLAEFTDAQDVASIVAKVTEAEGRSAAGRFRSLLGSIQRGEVTGDAPSAEAGPWPEEVVLEVPEASGPDSALGWGGGGSAPGDAVAALRARIARMQMGGARGGAS